jgi:uncharacterized protein YecE (DUF72 family)
VRPPTPESKTPIGLESIRRFYARGVTAPVRIGTCSFADDALVKHWYPKRLPAKERLAWYAEHYSAVEVDSTFYRVPDEPMVQGWADRTPPGFVIHIKAFGLMTRHPVRLEQLPPDLREGMPLDERGRVDRPPRERRAIVFREFLTALEPLRQAGKLGGILFQLPPYIVPKPSSFDYLEWARDQLGDDEMLVEFRHRDWFAEERRAQVLSWLEERRMSYVTVDAPRREGGSVPETVVAATSPLAYVRLPRPQRRDLERPGQCGGPLRPSLYRGRALRGGSAAARARIGRRAPTRSSTTTTRRTASRRPRPVPSFYGACSRSRACPMPEPESDGRRRSRCSSCRARAWRIEATTWSSARAAEPLVPLGQLHPRVRPRRRRRCGPMGRGLRHCLPVGDMDRRRPDSDAGRPGALA